MIDFVSKRFDDRSLETSQPGDAFEKFVDEFLRLSETDVSLVRGLAKGRDGAIDLVNAQGAVTFIAESKFIGAQTQTTAIQRWVEVENSLRTNLPRAARTEAAKKFRPWLRSSGGVRKYRFIVSAISSDADERITLRNRMRDFFTEISREDSELEHLASLDAEVVYWDEIVAQSSTFVPLFYRWFGGLPEGYEELSRGVGAVSSGFKQFLESDMLPYFSRERYDADTGQRSNSSEKNALEHLIAGNAGRAVIVSGPGGVGKTRLCMELCEWARTKGWWPVKLERFAQAEGLAEICKQFASAAKVLVFIDYAEAFTELERIPSAVRRLQNEGRHTVSIVTATRSSSALTVNDLLADIHPQALQLGGPGSSQGGYEAWLTEKILNHFDVPDLAQVAAACSGLPVLAAFAGFLFKRDRAKFAEQFGNLSSVNDFASWAAVRLKLVEDRFIGQKNTARQAMAQLAIQLPMSRVDADQFRASADLHAELLEMLVSDHWIEFDDYELSAAHDVFADTILARHLFGTPGLAQERLRAMLIEIPDAERLEAGFIALGRLAPHPSFAELSGKAAIEAVLAHNREMGLKVFPAFARSRLANPEDLISLLDGASDLKRSIGDAPHAHVVLARVAEWTVTKGAELVDIATARRALTDPLARAVGYPHSSNLVLRCAHAFAPASYEPTVLDWLCDRPVDIDSHYLIVSLLQWGTSTVTALPHLEAWLAPNAKELKASFVYKSWLDADGGVEAVREHILAWLTEHATALEADFVYKSWLDADGGVEAVREHILAWLTEHAMALETQFVYKSWLDADGGVEAVREHILAWLTEHTTALETQFVYKSWLDADGGVEAVREHILAWLTEHATAPEAGFIYRSWLDADGGVEAVREHILAWLTEHATAPEAGFIYRSWLDADGGVEAVREHILAWLTEHATALEADFVYKSWLKANCGFEDIQEHCENWLSCHWHTDKAVFLTKEISKLENLSKDTVARVVAWAGLHADNEDAIYRLSRTSSCFEQHEMGLAFRRLVFRSTEEVVRHLVKKPMLTEGEKQACSILFVNLSKAGFARDAYWSYFLELFAVCIRRGGIFRWFDGLWVTNLTLLLHDTLAANMIDPIAASSGVSELLEVIQQGMDGEEFTSLVESGYIGTLPVRECSGS